MVSPGPIRKRQLSSVGKNVLTQLITFLDESVLSGSGVYLKTIFFLSWIFSKILQGPPLVIFDCIIGSGDVHFPWILIFNNFTPYQQGYTLEFQLDNSILIMKVDQLFFSYSFTFEFQILCSLSSKHTSELKYPFYIGTDHHH